ncbi:MAG: hypothetical protein H6809_01655 [Phycisphaeraceae bacterium]|nr:hypothetical protein [Phycisphaeraceae bacterium]
MGLGGDGGSAELGEVREGGQVALGVVGGCPGRELLGVEGVDVAEFEEWDEALDEVGEEGGVVGVGRHGGR